MQKELNQLHVGRHLDYSHKIGRILAHMMICYYHGSGLPVLYLIFFVHLLIFYFTEKLLILRFYRKMEEKYPYVRQFLLHSFVFMFMFHLFRAIDLYGAEEIFPNSYYEDICLKRGTLLTCYLPKKLYYVSRMKLMQGALFLTIAVCLTVFYILTWFAHKRCLKKVIGCSSVFTGQPEGAISIKTLRNRNLVFRPFTYAKIDRLDTYRGAIRSVEEAIQRFGGDGSRPGSPGLPVDSQYELKSDANSGDDVQIRPHEQTDPVFNIYKADADHEKRDKKVTDNDRINSDDEQLENS